VKRVADVLNAATTARWPIPRNVKQLLRAGGAFDERATVSRGSSSWCACQKKVWSASNAIGGGLRVFPGPALQAQQKQPPRVSDRDEWQRSDRGRTAETDLLPREAAPPPLPNGEPATPTAGQRADADQRSDGGTAGDGRAAETGFPCARTGRAAGLKAAARAGGDNGRAPVMKEREVYSVTCVRLRLLVGEKIHHCWTSACFGPLAFAYSAA
jgi:hypothetical protein